jgi:hypothetical protein
MCQVLLPPVTEAAPTNGIISVNSVPSNAFDATTVMCGGTPELRSSVMFKSYR